MSDILYTYKDNLYINLTNQCPCSCTFCIRSQQKGLGTADDLWLDKDPTVEQVIQGFEQFPLKDFREVIFCGYGEPFCALDNMLAVSDYIHANSSCKVRVNTNGLGDLIHKKPTAHLLQGHLDAVSISLNAPDAQRYLEVTRPSFGIGSFDAMLRFAQDCQKYVPEVKLSIVDVLSPEEIAQCQAVAGRVGVPLRIRHFAQ